MFSRWHVQQEDPIRWRVVDDDHVVVCSGCTKGAAEEIAANRNVKDPIQTREDWWEAKNAMREDA